MQRLPSTNPGDTSKYANGIGTFDIGAADEGSKILLKNFSPLNLDLDFLNGSTDMLHAWEANYWTLDGDTPQIEWQIDADSLNVTAPPISAVFMTLYRPDERISGTYPVYFGVQTSIGNPGGVPVASSGGLEFFDVEAYGAIFDGVTDNSIFVANALSAAVAVGGGVLWFGHGTCITGPLALNSFVYYKGSGAKTTTIKLKAGSNADLLSAQTSLINLGAARNASGDGTLSQFGISDLTLDGNKANQTGGPSYPLRFYGFSYVIENVDIQNGYSGGWVGDWNGTSVHQPGAPDGVEARIHNLKVHDNNGHGLQYGGPHDSQFENFIPFSNSGMNLHLAPNAAGVQIDGFHSWGNFGTGFPGTLIEAGDVEFDNAVFESPSDTTQYCVDLVAKNVKIDGKCLSSGAFSGIKLGQDAGETPVPGQILQSAGVTLFSAADSCDINMIFEACTGTHGAVNFDKVHYGHIRAITIQASGTAYTGFLDPTNQYELLPPNGLTPDGSVGKGGQTRVAANSQNAFTVGDDQYLDYFNIATHTAPRFELPNGVYIQSYSDQYSTQTGSIKFGTGGISLDKILTAVLGLNTNTIRDNVNGNAAMDLSAGTGAVKFNLPIRIVPEVVSINGSTSGTFTIYEFCAGAGATDLKLCVCVSNNFRNGGVSVQSLALPSAFQSFARMWHGEISPATITKAGVTQNVGTVIGLPASNANVGTVSVGTTIAAYTIDDTAGGFDTINFNSGQATAHTGVSVWLGI